MYEQFRTELMARMSSFDETILETVLKVVDSVSEHYSIEHVNNQLITYNGGLPDVCKAYLVSRSIEGLSKRTLNLYKGVLTTFFKGMCKPLDHVETNDIRVWIYRYEMEKSISKRTLELYREIICGFFKWANADGWLQKNPAATIKPIKYIKKPRKAMEQIELEYIRSACADEQEAAIVEVMYSTGCRVSELCNIKKSDIDWKSNEVLLFGKGSKFRTSYLNAKAVFAIKRYLEVRKDNDEYLIVGKRAPHHQMTKGGIERIIRSLTSRISDKLSVPVTPHVFRHTTATTALQNGMPVQDVQRMLGHEDINTTMVYAEVQQSDVKAMHLKCVV